jgi:hypothetical protein
MEHEQRQYLLEDAPDTYYVTDYYEARPVVLVRLEVLAPDALRDLLSVSWRLAMKKAKRWNRARTWRRDRSPGGRRAGDRTSHARLVLRACGSPRPMLSRVS